jgi:hypothetical protein
MSSIIFDIETGPLPDDTIAALVPSFDEATVKIGNLKDPQKIRDKIDAARESHWKKYFDQAALFSITGQVLAIGFKGAGDEGCLISHVDDKISESSLLSSFWRSYMQVTENGSSIIGFNSNHFDLPFLVGRSRLNGVPLPTGIFDRGRFQHSVDLLEEWQLTNRNDYISLDMLAKAFGLDGKTGSGADFANLFANDRGAALEYLRHDVELTWEVAMRMQVI